MWDHECKTKVCYAICCLDCHPMSARGGNEQKCTCHTWYIPEINGYFLLSFSCDAILGDEMLTFEFYNYHLRVLEHVLLLETYTQESIPALHKIRYLTVTLFIVCVFCVLVLFTSSLLFFNQSHLYFRKYLVEATEEASIAYNKAVCFVTSLTKLTTYYLDHCLL